MKKTTVITTLFWLIFFTIVTTSILLKQDVQATDTDTAETQTTIGNATPSVSIVPGTPVTLNESSTSTAYATATVTDANGYEDIIGITAVLFDDTPANNDCVANGQNCYPAASTTCSLSSTSTTQKIYSCSAPLWYYANGSSNWKWYISAGDGDATGTQTSSAVVVNDLLAINISTSTIPYGTLSIGATSTEQTTTAQNTGNDTGLDVGIKESVAFNCTSGKIVPAQQHYSTTTSFDYAAGTALTSETATLDTSIEQPSDSTTTPSQAIYWLLVIPDAVSGSCTGTNYFEAQ